MFAVSSERRNIEGRSEAQRRLVEWMRSHPDGSSCDEVATAASISTDGAHRVMLRLASRWLVRCYDGVRWKAARLLLRPAQLRPVECEW